MSKHTREIFSESYQIKPKSDCIYNFPWLIWNSKRTLSVCCSKSIEESGKYNLISVWFNKIRKRLLRLKDVAPCLNGSSFVHFFAISVYKFLQFVAEIAEFLQISTQLGPPSNPRGGTILLCDVLEGFQEALGPPACRGTLASRTVVRLLQKYREKSWRKKNVQVFFSLPWRTQPWTGKNYRHRCPRSYTERNIFEILLN